MPVATALAAGERAARRRTRERGPFGGEPLGDLVGRESLGVAEVDLDETFVDPQVEAGRLDGRGG